MSDMRQKAASAVKWVAVSQASRIIAQLSGIVILARLLPPSDFGLIAMATVVTGFASLFSDFGTAAAIIQRRDPSPLMLDSIFWVNVALGMGVATAFLAVAPFVAAGFAEPRLESVLQALAVMFPIMSFGAVQRALLEKTSRFQPLAVVESLAVFVALCASIWAAFAGWGVFSLVLQALVAAFITTFGLWIVSRWRPRLRWSTGELHGVFGFSANLVGFNVVNYFVRNADNLLIGRFLGATDLGYYSMAYRLMLWPLQNISAVVGRVLFPVLSRIQNDTARIAKAYVGVTQAIVLITAPLMFGFFVLREPFVDTVLGAEWGTVAEVLAWLVPVGLSQSIGTSVGALYLTTGRTDVMFKWGVAVGFLLIPAFAIGLQWGVTGVAAAYALTALIRFYPGLAIPFRLVGLRVWDVVPKLMPTLLTAGLMSMVVALISVAWQPSTGYAPIRLAFLIAAGAITYIVLSLLTQRALLRNVMRLAFTR